MKLFVIILKPRAQLFFFGALALILLAVVLLTAPVQIPVVLYKLALVTIAAIVAVFFDFALFPYAIPASYLDEDWRTRPDADQEHDADYPVAKGYLSAFIGACLRRVLLVSAFVLAVSLGL